MASVRWAIATVLLFFAAVIPDVAAGTPGLGLDLSGPGAVMGRASISPASVHSDPPWSSETGPATGQLDETRPSLSTSHNATHLVFYQEEKGGDTDIAYARASQGGAWSGANFTDPATRLQRPAIASGDDLRAWAVAEDASNRSRIALFRSDDDGRTWRQYWLDPSAGSLKFTNVCCASIATFSYQNWGDGVVVAFEADQQGQANRTIAVAVTLDGGATWQVQSYPGAPRYSPSVTPARDTAAWILLGAEEQGADRNSIVIRIAVPSLVGTVQAFDTGAGVNDAHTSVSASGTTVLWAMHSGSGANYDVKVRASADAGLNYGAPTALASTLTNESSPCASIAGKTGLVAWGVGQSWTASISSDGGVTWGAAARVASTANTLASPDRNVGCSAEGTPATVWVDNRNSGTSKLDVLFANATDPAPPRVKRTIPAAGATGASTTDPVSVLFSEPMDAASVQAGFKITPAVSGNFTWAGMGLVHFNPEPPLAANTRYVVNLTGGKDRAGMTAADHEFNFTTGAGDTTPPQVQITAPANNSQVSGVVRISANATDNVKVAKVEFFVDGALKTTLSSPPWQYDWDTSPAGAGTHILKVTGHDGSGNQASAQITVTKQGGSDTQPPQVDLASPKNGANVNGTVRVKINATDNVAVAYVTFRVGPVERANLTASPYEFDWNTLQDANGAHVVYAKAVDTSGNAKEVQANVWIQNGGGAPPSISHLPVKNGRAGRDILFTANITDPDSGIANAWVKFRVGGGQRREVLMGPASGTGFEASIPGKIVTADIEYFLEAEDNQGLRARDPTDQAQYYAIAVDKQADEPPKITHALPPETRAGADLRLTATIRDEFGVAEAWVKFREIGTQQFAQVQMKGSGTEYEASLPGRFVNPPGLEYFIVAEDDSSQVATHPSDAPVQLHQVKVYPTADALEAFEMRIGGVLPLWMLLVVILLVIALAAAGAAAGAKKRLKATKNQLPWAGGDAGAKVDEKDRKGKKGKKGEDQQPPSLQRQDPGSQPSAPMQEAGPQTPYQQSPTGPAPVSRTSDSLVGPEAEWGFPMGPAAGPMDTEPSLLAPSRKCPRCGVENKPEAQWCRQCGSSMAAVSR